LTVTCTSAHETRRKSSGKSHQSMKGETPMKENNRVLGRKGARVLTQEEVAVVVGGLKLETQTNCTVPGLGYFDGDVFDGCSPF